MEGETQAAVVASLKVTDRSVLVWMKWYRDQGEDGLKLRPHPGPKSKLTPLQEDQVCLWLARDATHFGFRTNLWTSKLNPVEMLWSHLKFGHCVNLIPYDFARLDDEADVFFITTNFDS